MEKFFALRATLTKKNRLILEVGGLFFFIMLWFIVTKAKLITHTLLPSPGSVISSFPSLHMDDALILNLIYSIKLNVLGYMEALLVCIPLGFAIGLLPFLHGVLSKYIDAIRFLPITALTGLFIAWFGIENNMKVQFLAFGISVYLLPVVVQRVMDLDHVYQQTAFTLGASKWQMIKTVFIPGVLPKLSDDIRVLTAISWTYIIVAELLTRTGGVGAMIFTSAKQSRIDKVFALLLVIVLIGFLQDKLLVWIDKMLFPHKYEGDGSK
jgi:NitT/TauT family transport system permease protein